MGIVETMTLQLRALSIGALTFALPAMAQNAAAPDVTRAQENLGQAQHQLEVSKSRQDSLQAEIAAMIAEQDDLSARLVASADEISLREQALSETEGKVGALDKEAGSIRAELAAKRETLSRLLAGLQQLEQNPPPALVVSPDDILASLRGAMMFGAVVPEMKQEAEHLLNKLTRLDSIKRETAEQKTAARQQLASLQKAHARMTELLARQKETLGKTKADLDAERLRMAELARKATSLQQLLTGLAEEQERQAQQARTGEETARAAEEARQRALLSRPHLAISRAKGRLEYPVQGTIVAGFGQATSLGSHLSGLAIATEAGRQVRAPVDGTIEFAGPFRSYGELLILDAGEDYLVLLSGMQSVNVALGQTVRAGEPVGEMGETTASAALLGTDVSTARPVLYVEFRRNGEPVDSREWWIGGRKEAMQ